MKYQKNIVFTNNQDFDSNYTIYMTPAQMDGLLDMDAGSFTEVSTGKYQYTSGTEMYIQIWE